MACALDNAGCNVLLSGLPVAAVTAPRERLEYWLADPDLKLTFPDLSAHGETPSRPAPYSLGFRQGHSRRIELDDSGRRIVVKGDLDAFRRNDFRRIVMHVAKTAVALQEHALIHSACLRSPSGTGILLCGAQGSGKTTVSLALTRCGYCVMSTDIALLDPRLRVLAGTRHLNLYPALAQRWFPELCPPEGVDAAESFKKKMAVAPAVAQERGLFVGKGEAVTITHVFQIRLADPEPAPYAHPIEGPMRLFRSVILSEDWAVSTWLSPSWLEFFPLLSDHHAERRRHALARRLAELPHAAIRGDLEYVTNSIQEVAE